MIICQLAFICTHHQRNQSTARRANHSRDRACSADVSSNSMGGGTYSGSNGWGIGSNLGGRGIEIETSRRPAFRPKLMQNRKWQVTLFMLCLSILLSSGTAEPNRTMHRGGDANNIMLQSSERLKLLQHAPDPRKPLEKVSIPKICFFRLADFQQCISSYRDKILPMVMASSFLYLYWLMVRTIRSLNWNGHWCLPKCFKGEFFYKLHIQFSSKTERSILTGILLTHAWTAELLSLFSALERRTVLLTGIFQHYKELGNQIGKRHFYPLDHLFNM